VRVSGLARRVLQCAICSSAVLRQRRIVIAVNNVVRHAGMVRQFSKTGSRISRTCAGSRTLILFGSL